jgi:hypothetical protein
MTVSGNVLPDCNAPPGTSVQAKYAGRAALKALA